MIPIRRVCPGHVRHSDIAADALGHFLVLSFRLTTIDNNIPEKADTCRGSFSNETDAEYTIKGN